MFGIHPDAFRMRDELYEYGVGYNSPMKTLFVSSACKGSEILTYMYVGCWSDCTALELMRHPYEETYIGAEFNNTERLAWCYRNELPMPEPVTLEWISDLSDRWLNDPACIIASNKRERTQEFHAIARTFALAGGEIPMCILERLLADIVEERRRYQ